MTKIKKFGVPVTFAVIITYLFPGIITFVGYGLTKAVITSLDTISRMVSVI